jgi:hypothetical protein
MIDNHPFFSYFKKQRLTKLVPRPYDSRWKYLGIVKKFQSGFNAYSGKIYYNQISELSLWIQTGIVPENRLKRTNLVNEYLFLTHDFIHHWGMLQIETFLRKFLKKSLYSMAPENQVFFLLLTEAMATVGLDYWVLSQFPLGKQFNLEQDYHQLTITLSPSQVENIKKVKSDFTIHKKKLFSEIVAFYLSGEMQGFDVQDIEKSPDLKKYIVHELEYGEMQRSYARIWVDQIWHRRVSVEDDFSPALIKEDWQNDLIGYLEEVLWKLVHGECDEDLSVASKSMHIDLPKLTPLCTEINPLLISMEKNNIFDDELFLKRYPSAIEIYLSNVDILSIDIDDRRKLKERFSTEKDQLDMDWIIKNTVSFSSKKHLLCKSGDDIDDFIFSLP